MLLIGAKLKDDMRNRILQGWPFAPEEQRRILEYCDSDVDALCRLLRHIAGDETVIDVGVALHHGEFAAVYHT